MSTYFDFIECLNSRLALYTYRQSILLMDLYHTPSRGRGHKKTNANYYSMIDYTASDVMYNVIISTMLLLTNCEVHTEKHSDRSFDVRTERSECIAIIKDKRSKRSLNSALKMFVSSLNAAIGRKFFASSSISFKVKLSLEKVTFA